jgi:hypothetical protein
MKRKGLEIGLGLTKVLSQQLSGANEENYRTYQSGKMAVYTDMNWEPSR